CPPEPRYSHPVFIHRHGLPQLGLESKGELHAHVLTHSHTHILTHMLSLTHTHTHTHSHMHAYTHSRSLKPLKAPSQLKLVRVERGHLCVEYDTHLMTLTPI